MDNFGSEPEDEAQRLYAHMHDRLVRKARRTVGARTSTLWMLFRRSRDAKSLSALEAFEADLKSERPQPSRWGLQRILAALASADGGAYPCARRLAEALHDLVLELDALVAMQRALGKSER